jgi:hypothetical protein
MSSLKRKRNLLDKQKREIISYAKENPKLTQQIADNLTINWDLFILVSLYKCKMCVSRVETIWESFSFHLITWLPVFNVPQFIAKLVILRLYIYRFFLRMGTYTRSSWENVDVCFHLVMNLYDIDIGRSKKRIHNKWKRNTYFAKDRVCINE